MAQHESHHWPVSGEDARQRYDAWVKTLREEGEEIAANHLDELRREFELKVDEAVLADLEGNSEQIGSLKEARTQLALSVEQAEWLNGVLNWFIETARERVDYLRLIRQLRNPPNGGAN